MHMAAATPIVIQKRAEMHDRRLLSFVSLHIIRVPLMDTYFLGACVNANSSPVMMIKASEKATRMYAGAWIQTWMLFGSDL